MWFDVILRGTGPFHFLTKRTRFEKNAGDILPVSPSPQPSPSSKISSSLLISEWLALLLSQSKNKLDISYSIRASLSLSISCHWMRLFGFDCLRALVRLIVHQSLTPTLVIILTKRECTERIVKNFLILQTDNFKTNGINVKYLQLFARSRDLQPKWFFIQINHHKILGTLGTTKIYTLFQN